MARWGQFDLILFSEVLYFLNESDLMETCAHTGRSILPGGRVLLVNYTGETDDPGTGDTAATFFIKATAPAPLLPILQRRKPHITALTSFRSPAATRRTISHALALACWFLHGRLQSGSLTQSALHGFVPSLGGADPKDPVAPFGTSGAFSRRIRPLTAHIPPKPAGSRPPFP